MGFNYCKTAWDDYHKHMPNQPIIITEASSNSGTRAVTVQMKQSDSIIFLTMTMG